jgi:SAM-dependent methyltransferase
VNDEHLAMLVSDGWRSLLADFIVPWALEDADLGPDVLEVGPGPGLTTDLLRDRVPRLTAVELDAALAADLGTRLAGTGVDVVNADATSMPFDDGRFSGAVCFTMLHHVPTTQLQDALFADVARVLQPGGVFVASDSVASDDLAALHTDDVYNPVDPATVDQRLLAAGFSEVAVRSNEIGWTARATVGA